jgi:aryl-alcohol dehydrogenase-like predicted oxidoreductase
MRNSAIGMASASVLACSKTVESPSKMPVRVLGKTGLSVSILSFGGGSQFLKSRDGDWEPILQKAIAEGVNLFDTSSAYQWGASKSSEERFGEILPAYRKQVIISTKVDTRDVSKGLLEFERSLERMKTDYVDILLIHSIEPSEDLAALEQGMYKELVRLKKEGQARFIGFSSMNSAEKSRHILEAFDVDVCILAMNATKYGNFAKIALPAAQAKNVGVIAMKIMRDIVGVKASAHECMQYAWTQPGVASAVVAHSCMDHLAANIDIAKDRGAGKRSALNRDELEQRLAGMAGPHALRWARSDYYDGLIC